MNLLSIAGKIASVGPRWRDRQDTIYRHLEFHEEGVGLRRLREVRAPAEIAALVKKQAVGRFLFWVLVGEYRLWCVDRTDGSKRVDFEVLYKVVSTREAVRPHPRRERALIGAKNVSMDRSGT